MIIINILLDSFFLEEDLLLLEWIHLVGIDK